MIKGKISDSVTKLQKIWGHTARELYNHEFIKLLVIPLYCNFVTLFKILIYIYNYQSITVHFLSYKQVTNKHKLHKWL